MYHGDIRLGDTIDIKFTTRQISGAPTTLAGTPVISAYPGNSTTQLTAGITLSVDFDTVTGLNNVRVVATSGNGYATATNYTLVITTGTVNSVSVVGECIGSFSIENRSALMPTTPARTLVVDASGLADANAVKLGPTGSGTAQTARDLGAGVLLGANAITEAAFDTTPGSIIPLGIIDQGTAQSATGTTLVLRPAASFADNTLIGSVVYAKGSTQGYWQERIITANVGATDTVTVDAWTVTPSGTITYQIGGSPPNSSAGTVSAQVTGMNAGVITAASIAAAAFNGKGDWNVGKTGYTLSAAGISAIFQNTTAGDFTVAASFGKSIMNGVALGTGLTVNDLTTKTGFALTAAYDPAKTAAQAGDPMTLTSGERNSVADAFLDRNMATGTDSGSPTVRTPRQALRASRNKWSIAAGTLTVTKEDDATSSWTAAVTTTAGNPISTVDPA